MNVNELKQQAKATIGEFCKVCPVCNGKACRNCLPGPGSRGDVAERNYNAWQQVRLNLDTIAENKAPSTTLTLFGQTFSSPIFAGPVGAVNLHYGESYDDSTYNETLILGMQSVGSLAFTGDGTNPDVLASACLAIQKAKGQGVPTIKPWDEKTLEAKIALAKASNPVAIAMDIDAAGLPFLKNATPPAGSKTVAELKAIAELCKPYPLILKGIMTVKGALKAREAGASGIVVSNHGGRVLEGVPSTCEVLPRIRQALGKNFPILVDGGLRRGTDILKALALGANAVLVARPFVTAVYGGGQEGVACQLSTLNEELKDAMRMCGVHSLGEIDERVVWVEKFSL